MTAGQDKFDLVMFNMASFYDWEHGVINRNYNILQSLAKEKQIEKILSVDFLPNTLKQAVSHYIKNILIEPKNHEMIYGDLTSSCWQRTDKIFVYSSIDSYFSHKIVGRELRRIEKIINLKNVVFWSYNPMFVDFIGRLNEKLFIFDAVDNWTEHPNYLRMMSKKKILNKYKIIAEKADIIFTVSEQLLDFFQKLGRTKDIYWIPNGVNFDHFNDPSKIKIENELSNFTKPIIGYLGTIEHRVDLDLIALIAKEHKDKEIVLCGPIWPKVKKDFKKKLGHLENVHTLGRVEFEKAPSYVNKFDVAIIPHKINDFVNSMNPMKLYDYLACGKPVVSTAGAGMDMFKNLIYIAGSQGEFSQMINKAIENNSPELESTRKSAVKEHSWRSRADKMTEIIYKQLY